MKRQRSQEPMASSSAPAGSSSGNNAPDGSGDRNEDNNGSANANVPDNGPEPPHYYPDSSFQIKAPTFDNTVKGFPSYLTKCNIYKAQMKVKSQEAFLGINLLTQLTGVSYRLCEDIAEDTQKLEGPVEDLFNENIQRLQLMIADKLRLRLGEYYHFAHNLHLYNNIIEKINE